MLNVPRNGRLSQSLLRWYDDQGRDLPWRKKGGVRAHPYGVWMSEIMLQQTTVAAVAPYYARFMARFPKVEDLAAAEDAEVMEMWAGLGYYARARNLLKCARVVAREYGGAFPSTQADLIKLPGIGPYTSAAIAAISFDEPVAVVDGNVERVITRLKAIDRPLPDIKDDIKVEVGKLVPPERPGDFAQATMDLGATICTPRSPKCLLCPWREDCAAHALGRETDFPVKPPKKTKPMRTGIAFWLEHDGHVMLIRRPDKGLLGGMLALPSTAWSDAAQPVDHMAEAPLSGDWQLAPEHVRHVFTHFELKLGVAQLVLDRRPQIDGALWTPIGPSLVKGLPTVMKKAVKLYL